MEVVVEPFRLLHVRSEYGYTDRVDRAMPDEPEAVQPGEQRQLTERAARSAAERAREVWLSARDRMTAELTLLNETRFDVDIASDLRVIERALDKVNRRLTA